MEQTSMPDCSASLYMDIDAMENPTEQWMQSDDVSEQDHIRKVVDEALSANPRVYRRLADI